MLPYVVSADIYLLLAAWAQAKGFILPDDSFFLAFREKFVDQLIKIFSQVDLLAEMDLLFSLRTWLAGNRLPIVSLDRVYLPSLCAAYHPLELTRAVGQANQDLGLRPRAGAPNLIQQLASLSVSGQTEVALVDDVIFSGDLLFKVITVLERRGIRVGGIYAGVGIAEGLEKIARLNVPVSCAFVYDQVVDEVCERDFYPGVPLAGRLLVGSNNVGIPYILPDGQPGRWASIPEERQSSFSKFCWQQTSDLFSAIEECSGWPVLIRDLGRSISSCPVPNARFSRLIQEKTIF
ncbi:MAG: hypothetical protein WC456_00885 [Patescibacteria group bacterium]